MRILVTGSCGFVGTNIVKRFAPEHHVIGIDNLSRADTDKNLLYLRRNFIWDFRKVDITNFDFNELPEVDVIFHMAAQVGVQSSINDPVNDFNQNILGTVKVLEYARRHTKKPIVIYASTNKVYGDIQVDKPVSEDQPLNFHTPYGVSKGSADQYVLDYSRIFGVPGVVFRQSCIYGTHQLGKEEQGWVAWFIIANHTGQPLTIYGDGTQVRDALFVDDLVDLYTLAIEKIDLAKGQAFNAGGGIKNILSLNDLVKKANITTPISYSDWRPADQKYYVSDISKLKNVLGWEPKIGVDEGLSRLKKFVEETWQK